MRQLFNFAFSFHFEEVIWKTSVDRGAGLLALELRDHENLKTSFSVLNVPAKRIGKQFQVEGADWWSSLLLIKNNHLFVEKYEDAQNPLDKSLIVASANDGSVVKHLPGHQLVEVRDRSIVIQKIEDPAVRIEEQLSGKSQTSDHYDFFEPMVFPEGSDNFEMVKSFLGKNIVSQVDYLEWGDYIIISYFIPEEKEFSRRMMVLKDEREVFRAVLDQKMDGVAPGGFFVFKNFLIFIIERNQINAIEL